MKKVLVIHKGTGQAKAFERFSKEYTQKNNINIDWLFCEMATLDQTIASNEVSVVLISPEMILVEKDVKAKLDSANIPYVVMKPTDFGLKRLEKILPSIDQYIK